jgi:HD-like signal output (HDOD) protein/GGDEF domain-containing protein
MPDCNSTLDRLVDRCGQLYSLPTVAVRVLALTESPTVDARAIKECIENDPALTSKVLRVVNSSLFGLSREVTDLTQAIGLLGINPLKLLVLGFSLPDRLFVGLNGEILRRYWHRTLVKAVAAREISQAILGKPGDEAFIAGLLQDIGALVLLQEMGESYARLFGGALERSANIGETERATLGFDHATLSARLLQRWRLPEQLTIAVEAGQSRERTLALAPEDRSLAEVLLLADLVGSLLAESRTDLLAELLDRGQECLALSHTQLALLVTTLAAKVEHLAEVLELDLPQGLDYPAVLIKAHARLSAVACDAAAQLLARQAATNTTEPDQGLLDEGQRLADETAGALCSNETAVRRETAAECRAVASVAGAATQVHGRLQATSLVRDGSFPSRSADRTSFPAVKPRPTTPTAGDLGHDPGFVGRVAAAVATCRQARRSLSLLVVEIDQYEDLLFTRGPVEAERLVEALGAECRSLDHPGAAVVQSREVQFAIILPACDRRQAVDVSNELISRVRRMTPSAAAADAAVVTVSVGVTSVALPPKNFPAAELIRAAERCLNGARLSGGNAVKSIEIY